MADCSVQVLKLDIANRNEAFFCPPPRRCLGLPSGNVSMRQQAGKTVPTLQARDHAKMRQAWTEPTPQALDHARKRHAWTEPTRQALDYAKNRQAWTEPTAQALEDAMDMTLRSPRQ